MTSRRFPPLWTVIEHAESFWVQDARGQTDGWFYFRNDPLVAKMAGVLLKDKARRMAAHGGELRWPPFGKPPGMQGGLNMNTIRFSSASR